MNPTQFERVKTELKWAFYAQNTSSGNLVIIRKCISAWNDENTLSTQQNVLSRERQGPRVLITSFPGALYQSGTAKGYRLTSAVGLETSGADPIWLGGEDRPVAHRSPAAAPWLELERARQSWRLWRFSALFDKPRTWGRSEALCEPI